MKREHNAILNGKPINTKNYDIGTVLTKPANKTLRWWTIFVCFSLLFLGCAYQNIPDWLGIARFSGFEPRINVSIVCQPDWTMKFLDGVAEVRELYPNIDIEYIDRDETPTNTVLHLEDDLAMANAILHLDDERLFRMQLRDPSVSNVVLYEVFADKDTLLELLAACEDDIHDESSSLPGWLNRLRPYPDKELLEVLIMNNSDNVTFLKECLNHDVVAGLKFTYRWSAEYHKYLYQYYDWAIEEMHLSFAQAVYIAEAIIFVLALFFAAVVTCGLASVIDLITGDADDDDDDEPIGKSDFDYFGRHDYREPNREYDDEDDDDEEYDEEDDEDNFPDDYEDYPDRDRYSLT